MGSQIEDNKMILKSNNHYSYSKSERSMFTFILQRTSMDIPENNNKAMLETPPKKLV